MSSIRANWVHATEENMHHALADYGPEHHGSKAEYDGRGWRVDGAMQPACREARGYPPRQAIRYTAAEVKDILLQVELGFDFEEIAEWHGRNANGIATLAYRCYREIYLKTRPNARKINHQKKRRKNAWPN